MLNRLLHGALGLFGFCGVAALMVAVVFQPETIARYENLVRESQRVQARLLSVGVRQVAAGRQSNRPGFNYTPTGTFEIVGQEGVVYKDVDLDEGTLRVTEEEAKQAAARYRGGMVLDAWFDPRSRNDPAYFPLTITDPAVAAAQERATRQRLIWIGASLLAGSGIAMIFLFRRQSPPP